MSAGQKLFNLLNPKSDLSQLPHLEEDWDDSVPLPRRRIRPRHILGNGPLMFGGLIIIGLFLVVLFGPLWAPRNPYIATQRIGTYYDDDAGQWVSPPLNPSPEYPLGTDEYGNDILSLLLYGARTTLVAAAFIAMVRVLLGLILGAYAGWHEGELSDQFIMGMVGVITAVPILISSIILIYALDIRRGLPVFIVALAVIGWTEIAQYIRGEFMVLRQMPFIEGARAAGAGNLAIAVRHILPNLLPLLLVITFLELGATLMLMGELAFVGVFIGGGSRIGLGDEITGIQVLTLSEVPEWGAMLAEGYRWLRAKPFIVFPPAIAFFIAAVGFNAFGEGLRRFIEKYHVSTNFLLRKRMVLLIAALTYATVFVINNTGPAPWFAKVARAFDGESAYVHNAALAEMNGRAVGQPGGDEAAAYIAAAFEQYGLDPGWRQSNYIYPRSVTLARPLAQPELTLMDGDGRVVQTFRHQLDFGTVIAGHGGGGEVTLPLTFVGFTDGETPSWPDFKKLDLRGRIVLLQSGDAPADFAAEALIRGAEGILWISGDGLLDVRSQVHAADPDHFASPPTIPIFRIRPAVADALLAQAGIAWADLFTLAGADQQGPGWYTQEIDTTVQMGLQLSQKEETAVPTVMGYLPGSDFTLANEMVVLLATYDGLGTDPDGTLYPGANRGASGVAVLLELARLWQEQSLQPRRSVLFVAWGGGQINDPGLVAFLNDEYSFRHLPAQSSGRPLAPVIIIQLDYAGAGGEALVVHPSATPRLVDLVQAAAADGDIPLLTEGAITPADIPSQRVEQAAWLHFAWADAAVPPDQDTLDRIEAVKLQQYGEILSYVLTTVVRQTSY